jgi:hypothetical protein
MTLIVLVSTEPLVLVLGLLKPAVGVFLKSQELNPKLQLPFHPRWRKEPKEHCSRHIDLENEFRSFDRNLFFGENASIKLAAYCWSIKSLRA